MFSLLPFRLKWRLHWLKTSHLSCLMCLTVSPEYHYSVLILSFWNTGYIQLGNPLVAVPSSLDPCDRGCASLDEHGYSTCCVFIYLHFSSEIEVLEFNLEHLSHMYGVYASSPVLPWTLGKCVFAIFCKKYLSWRKWLMLLFLSVML